MNSLLAMTVMVQPSRRAEPLSHVVLNRLAKRWQDEVQKAANQLNIGLKEESVSVTAEPPDVEGRFDLCTMLSWEMDPLLLNVMINMLMRKKASLFALLTAKDLPDREEHDWMQRWDEAPLVAAGTTESGLLLPMFDAPDETLSLSKSVVCYGADAGIAHARWIMQRALENREISFRGDLPT